MNETTVTIIVAVITALGSVITAAIGWLARKGVNYLDHKTSVLDEASQLQKKELLKQRIVDVVTLVARSTMQTYVDALKQKNADGKLTKEEAKEAFSITFNKALAILKDEGIDISHEILAIIVEAVVGSIKPVKKTLRDEAY